MAKYLYLQQKTVANGWQQTANRRHRRPGIVGGAGRASRLAALYLRRLLRFRRCLAQFRKVGHDVSRLFQEDVRQIIVR